MSKYTRLHLSTVFESSGNWGGETRCGTRYGTWCCVRGTRYVCFWIRIPRAPGGLLLDFHDCEHSLKFNERHRHGLWHTYMYNHTPLHNHDGHAWSNAHRAYGEVVKVNTIVMTCNKWTWTWKKNTVINNVTATKLRDRENDDDEWSVQFCLGVEPNRNLLYLVCGH